MITVLFLIIVLGIGCINIPNLLNVSIWTYENAESVIKSKEGNINTVIDTIEETYTEGFISKYGFINLNGLSARAMGCQQVKNVIKLNNGYLSWSYGKFDVEKYGNAIIDLKEYLTKKEIEYLYVAVPYKVDLQNSQVPTGVDEFSNANQNEMLELLEAGDVACFDLRKKMEKRYEDWYSAFFHTDHHWKPETGFWAYTEVAKVLNEDYGIALDESSMDINNYEIEIYEDIFLGSQGKRTGQYFAGVDDMSIIIPKMATNMRVEIPVHNVIREGSYEEVMFKWDNLKKDYFNLNPYAAYIGGDYPLCIQKNNSAQNDKKILILKDSFTIATQPYYSFLFKEVDVIDLRHFTDGTLKEYIDKTNPDMVITLYTSSMFAYPEAFEYGIPK